MSAGASLSNVHMLSAELMVRRASGALACWFLVSLYHPDEGPHQLLPGNTLKAKPSPGKERASVTVTVLKGFDTLDSPVGVQRCLGSAFRPFEVVCAMRRSRLGAREGHHCCLTSVCATHVLGARVPRKHGGRAICAGLSSGGLGIHSHHHR